jgi:hypothetical protein
MAKVRRMAREGGVGEYGRPIDKDREYIGMEVKFV